MATLKRYNTFKSLKKNAPSKAVSSAIHKDKVKAEMQVFIQLLTKTKAKKTPK